LTLVARTAGEPASLTRSVINTVRSIDAEQPVLNIQTMDQVVEESLGQRPLAMLLLAAFAALALLLATVGIYSVLAYTVRQRVREIGIRMALGAPRTSVLQMVGLMGLKLVAIGAVIGVLLSVASTKLIANQLWNVSPLDPLTLVSVVGLMTIVGMAACYFPARRAMRLDPVVALRGE
jgi:putative ABC transport system permease protein